VTRVLGRPDPAEEVAKIKRRLTDLERKLGRPFPSAAPTARASLEWAIIDWTNVSVSNVAVAAEVSAASVDNMVGGCCSLSGGRVYFSYEGTYEVHLWAGLGTFTPGASGQFTMSIEMRDSSAGVINGTPEANVPIISGITNSNPRVTLTRVEPMDAGGHMRLSAFQRSGANRNLSARTRVVYLGDAPYPY
jgi:hypothetical protein